jgi:hypothetical protein
MWIKEQWMNQPLAIVPTLGRDASAVVAVGRRGKRERKSGLP